MRVIFIILLVIILLMTFMFSRCKIMSKTKSSKSDSTIVNNNDSSALSKRENRANYDSGWWREIISFLPQPKGGDTVINNTTVPVNNYYPTQIVREGGSVSKEWLQKYMDSVSQQKKDSTTVREAHKDSSTKAELLSPFQIIGICAGISLLMILLSKLKISVR